MPNIQDILNAISTADFSSSTLQFIDNYTNDIQNGTTNFNRLTIPEHAGLCMAGSAFIGASIVASYARASLTASRDASGSQGKYISIMAICNQRMEALLSGQAITTLHEDVMRRMREKYGFAV